MGAKTHPFPGGQYWWDRHTRSWVIQSLDAAGNQVGEADYVGTKAGRDLCVKARATARVRPAAPRPVMAKPGDLRLLLRSGMSKPDAVKEVELGGATPFRSPAAIAREMIERQIEEEARVEIVEECRALMARTTRADACEHYAWSSWRRERRETAQREPGGVCRMDGGGGRHGLRFGAGVRRHPPGLSHPIFAMNTGTKALAGDLITLADKWEKDGRIRHGFPLQNNEMMTAARELREVIKRHKLCPPPRPKIQTT